MCIAIVATQGKVVPDSILEYCAEMNDDGGGMAYMGVDGKVVIDKGYMQIAPFKGKYHSLLADKVHERGPMLLHFRIATAGMVTSQNTHPFKVKGGALIHNGSFWYGSDTDIMSDTRMFAGMMHNKFDYENVNKYRFDMENVASYNKLAFLHDNGKYTIINESLGTWDDGVWYSHSNYNKRY